MSDAAVTIGTKLGNVLQRKVALQLSTDYEYLLDVILMG